jgi:hypothetical protein
MDPDTARAIAYTRHRSSRDRHGRPLIEHVARVAAAVPPEAVAVAWLHDVLEKTEVVRGDTVLRELDPVQRDALDLLTRAPADSYQEYLLRIVDADGEAGRLAREVKLADLDDHLRTRSEMDAEGAPYGWARRRIAGAQARRSEDGQSALVPTGSR